MTPLSLLELNGLVRETLRLELDGYFWIAAELSEVRPASGGHCYLEFVEKDAFSGALAAKARGTIWRHCYTAIAARFEQATGRRFAAGLKILAQVEINFHELYGYSLNVVDIDPSYTLGDVARRRQEILAQLEADGVRDLNKELRLPRPVRRVAVVSSATAAGYGDFCHQLSQSGFVFTTRLFGAVMQGERVERSIIDALNAIAAESGRWDAVAIIRGGGAVSDLNGFDSYELAANVAQFPLPVLTGIGHERDETVIDSVAFMRLKTPTAVAAYLIESRQAEERLVDRLAERLDAALRLRLEREQTALYRLAARLGVATTQYGSRQRQRLARVEAEVRMRALRRLMDERRRLDARPQRLEQAVGARLTREHHRLELAGRTLRLAGPERILRLGFSITLVNGRVVRSVADIRPGERLVTRLADGEVASRVERVDETPRDDGHTSEDINP